MKRSSRFVIHLCLLGAALLGATRISANTAVVPAIRPDYSPEQLATWMKRHEEFVAIARQGKVDVLFLGDSITDYWRSRGKPVWDRNFASLRAANFGISGDRTQQVLWRITHGELDGIQPQVVVLLIGTNNTDPGLGTNSLTPKNTVPEIIEGITAIVRTVQAKVPGVKILLLGVFPRGQKDAPVRREIAAINAGATKLADGRKVRFLDVGPKFLTPDGDLPAALMPDLLHPNEAGYEIWAAALKGPLAELLEARP
jgi:lysophospholipase L1-like esterase